MRKDLVYLGTDDPKMQFSINAGVDGKDLISPLFFREQEKRTVWREKSTWRIRCAQLTKTEVTSLSEILGPRRIPRLLSRVD